MVFSSTIFLFLFLPVVLLIYYNPVFTGRSFRNVFLLLASLLFYAWGEPVFVFLMIFSIGITWFLGLRIIPGESKAVLALGTVYHVAVLFVFKYFTFALGEWQLLWGKQDMQLSIALPIGI